MNEIEKTRPTEPTPPKYDFKAPPKPSKYNNMALFRKAMVKYNIEFMEYKKEMETVLRFHKFKSHDCRIAVDIRC